MNRLRKSPRSSARSPFAGCGILIVALLVMVFLIVFSIAALFRQFNEIAKFTATAPVPAPLESLDNREAALNDLAERLEAFRQQLAGKEAAELALTPADLNLAIAAYDSLRELRGTFHITAVDADHLRIAIAFPLNGKPRLTRRGESGWLTSDARYLNGTLVPKPVMLKHEVALALDAIDVPNAKVPHEFIGQMSPYRLAQRYLDDPVLGPAMAKLTNVSIANGKLVFSKAAGEAPADSANKRAMRTGSRRFFKVLGVIACVVLLIAGGVVFAGLRARAKR